MSLFKNAAKIITRAPIVFKPTMMVIPHTTQKTICFTNFPDTNLTIRTSYKHANVVGFVNNDKHWTDINCHPDHFPYAKLLIIIGNTCEYKLQYRFGHIPLIVSHMKYFLNHSEITHVSSDRELMNALRTFI